jgi:tripartite-type tricarboxylate transporter receptor subunit TctC
MGVDPASVPWVPSNGAAPGLQDLVAGGVQIAPVSLPEARSLIDAGKVKSLAVMADTRAALYPNVPTLKEATGSNWTVAAWRGIATPKNIPPEARDKLVAAIKKIVASKDYTDFMAQRGFGVIYQGPEDFAKFMVKSDTDLGATMKAVGIVK